MRATEHRFDITEQVSKYLSTKRTLRRVLWVLPIALFALTACHDSKRKVVEQIADYANYATVDWSELDEMYRPNCADWSEEIEARFCEGFPREIAASYWHLLQNARTDFHRKSLPLRVGASADAVERIVETEALFDTVFVRCISQEYYMRLLPDIYNEVMPHALDALVKEL
jgi:hypothetical protein